MGTEFYNMGDDALGFLDTTRVASLEGAESISVGLRAFFTNVTAFFSNAETSQLEKAFNGRPVKALTPREISKLRTMDQETYEAISLAIPKNLKARYFIYAITELAQLRGMVDYEERLLDPLLIWVKDITAGSQLRNVKPTKARLRPAGLRDMAKETASLFKNGNVDVSATTASIHDAFSRRSDVAVLQEAVDETYSLLGEKVSLSKLLAKEKQLATMVNSLVSRYEVEIEQGTSELTNNMILELADGLRQAANEQSKLALLRFSMIRIDSNILAIRNGLK